MALERQRVAEREAEAERLLAVAQVGRVARGGVRQQNMRESGLWSNRLAVTRWRRYVRNLGLLAGRRWGRGAVAGGVG